MALTKKQIELRSHGLGASDARTVMYGDAKAWQALYDEKVNGIQPTFKPDQLYLMALGIAVEPLTMKRFNDKVKPLAPIEANRVIQWKTDPFFMFSPDGIVHDTQEPVQAKFHTGDKNILELADYYMPQLQHEILCMGTTSCWLAVTFGHYGRFMHTQVKRDEDAIDAYLRRSMDFRVYLQTGTMPDDMSLPGEFKVERKRDHLWLPGDNQVAALAGEVLDNYESAGKFDDALDKLKKLFPKDAQTATWVDANGAGLKMTADRAGKIRWVPLFSRTTP